MKNRYTNSIKRCLLFTASLFALQIANAQDELQVGDLYFNINTDESTLEITGSVTSHFSSTNGEEENYNGLITAEIPGYIRQNRREYPVTSI